MNVIIFGASGMVGQGVLRECLLAPEIERVLVVGRSASGQHHAKLREIIRARFDDLSDIEGDLGGYDACFYCLGVSAAAMSEAEYTRVTFDFALAAARLLVRRNPKMTFIYVSGAGTDASGRAMWARVKGRTESALRELPFKAAVMFRPAFIQPLHGIVSRTPLYRVLYAVLGPLYPVWRVLFPSVVTTTENVAKAMIRVAARGADRPVLENRDINRVATAAS